MGQNRKVTQVSQDPNLEEETKLSSHQINREESTNLNVYHC